MKASSQQKFLKYTRVFVMFLPLAFLHNSVRASPSWENKNVLVTGATSGIGEAIAKYFVDEGAAKVMITSRSQSRINEAILRFNEEGYEGKMFGFQGETSSPQEASQLVQRIYEIHGPVEVLVNNAGSWEAVAFVDVTDDMLSQNLDAVKANFFVTQAVLKQWVGKNIRGNVINIGSDSIRHVLTEFPCAPHAIQKSGLTMIGNSVAVEFASRGIRANTIALGSVSKSAQDSNPDYDGMYPLGRIGRYKEVAKMVAFLADDNRSG